MGAYDKYNVTLVTADAAVKASSAHIWAVLLTAQGADVDVVLYDDPDSANGDKVFQASALNGTTVWVPLKDVGGIAAPLGIYADITGSGVQCYVWFE